MLSKTYLSLTSTGTSSVKKKKVLKLIKMMHYMLKLEWLLPVVSLEGSKAIEIYINFKLWAKYRALNQSR